jgi:transcriptional regulator with XRE-family HTH domain
MTKSIYSERLELLCAFLVEARSEAGLTQRQLAARLKRPHSYVAKVEIGERRLDVIEFIEICEKIGIEPSQLVKDVQEG